MDLGPGFCEPLLSARQAPSDQFDFINSNNGDIILIIRMKMRPMVLSQRLHKHSNDYPKKAEIPGILTSSLPDNIITSSSVFSLRIERKVTGCELILAPL
jgi:hypothetical protein